MILELIFYSVGLVGSPDVSQEKSTADSYIEEVKLDDKNFYRVSISAAQIASLPDLLRRGVGLGELSLKSMDQIAKDSDGHPIKYYEKISAKLTELEAEIEE